MPIISRTADFSGSELSDRITEAIHGEDIEGRVEAGLSVIEHAMINRIENDGSAVITGTRYIDVEPQDFFDLLSVIMDLPEPAARRVGLAGLTAAFDAPDFVAFRISCLAVQRFCEWADLPSLTSH